MLQPRADEPLRHHRPPHLAQQQEQASTTEGIALHQALEAALKHHVRLRVLACHVQQLLFHPRYLRGLALKHGLGVTQPLRRRVQRGLEAGHGRVQLQRVHVPGRQRLRRPAYPCDPQHQLLRERERQWFVCACACVYLHIHM